MTRQGLLPLVLCGAFALTGCHDEDERVARLAEREPVSLQHAFEALGEQGARAEVTLLDDASRSFSERWRLLAEAERSLDVAYFILADDVFGRALLGRLYERSRDGVRVRLLVDARGSKALLSAFGARPLLEELAASGARVHVYNPPLESAGAALKELSPLLPVARSHLKLVLQDERAGIVGGRNIARGYFASPLEDPRVAYDVDVLVAGRDSGRDLVRAFEADFTAKYHEAIAAPPLTRSAAKGEELSLYAHAMDIWLAGGLGPLSDVAEPEEALMSAAIARLASPPSRLAVRAARASLRELVAYESLYGAAQEERAGARRLKTRVLYDGSRTGDVHRAVWQGMLSALRAAEDEVHIESPYLVLTDDGLEVLEELSRRGVEVHLYTNGPRSSDNDLSQALFIEAWPEILARVPTLRLYVSDGRQLMHAKRLVIDNKLTFIGTYNLDLLSALVNSEIMLAMWDETFARDNAALMSASRAQRFVRRYEIERDEDGAPVRYPPGHARAGQVVVRYGPSHHVSEERLTELRLLRRLVMTFDSWTELQPAVK